jgi:hypothetical protein
MSSAKGDVLWAAAKTIGDECAYENAAFFECKAADTDPEKCLTQGFLVSCCVNRT